MRDIVFTVADHTCHGKTFDIRRSFFAIPVSDIVDGAFVILLEYIDVKYVFAHKLLVGYRSDDIFTIPEEDDHVIDIRTVGYEFILLQCCSDKSFITVDVEFLVGLYHFGGFDGVEVAQFGAAREVLSVFAFQHLIPVYGIVHDVSEVIVDFGDLFFHTGDQFIGFVGVELQDAPHLDFHQFENILFGHFTDKARVERSQAVVDMCAGGVHVFGLLELFVLIDSFFDKYFFEGSEME